MNAAHSPGPVVVDAVDGLVPVEPAGVGRWHHAGQIVDGSRDEIDMPAAPDELREVVAVPIEARRVARGRMLVDADEAPSPAREPTAVTHRRQTL